MRGAGGLAGCGSALVSVLLVVVAVVVVPVLLAPVLRLPGQRRLGILHGSVLRAELLAELGRARGTYLHALAAGDAVFGVDLGAVGGGGEILVVEQLRAAQGVAGAHMAVADGKNVVSAVAVGDLVHVAVVLGALQQLHDFLVAHEPRAVVVGGIDGIVAHEDADLILQLAAALAAHTHALAADAVGHGKLALIFLPPVGQVLDVQRLALVRDRVLDRDHVETQTGAAGRHHMGDHLQRQLAHLIEEFRCLGVLLHDLLVEHEVFRVADDKDRQHILLVVVGVVPVILHDADVAHLFEQGSNLLLVPLHLFCQRLRRRGLAHAHLQQHPRHVVREDLVQHPVFRALFIHLHQTELRVHAVGEHLRDLHDQGS